MATSWLACLAEPDKWFVSCVKWLDWVVDSEFTRFHMAAESVWICRVLQELAMLILMKVFFFCPLYPSGKRETFCLPILTVMIALQVLLSALFSLWWFATREHVEIINFKPCQTHFPHMHGVHHHHRPPPPMFTLTLPSETLAQRSEEAR